MAGKIMPRYPVYVPSKGRVSSCPMARVLGADGVPFSLVVEPQEFDAYAARFGADHIITLPFRDRGLIAARNYIKDHATAAGYSRHWQLDDNIHGFSRRWKSCRLWCRSGVALRVVEDLTDRYSNVAVSGMNYDMFAPEDMALPPFYLNARVYSASLVSNEVPHRYRLRYNDDTDFCLQVIADGWCTILVNAFLAKKNQTMRTKGGNTADLYQDDGRLEMARSLERAWPGVVETDRRFRRPQHVVRFGWKKFDTPLKLKPGVDLSAMPEVDEYGMRLVEVRTPKDESIRRIFDDYNSENFSGISYHAGNESDMMVPRKGDSGGSAEDRDDETIRGQGSEGIPLFPD